MNWHERKQSLASLKFPSYQHYLRSPLWKQIRARVFARAEGRCEDCQDNPPTEVHHLSYGLGVMSGNDDLELRAVCSQCHEWRHGITGKPVSRKRRRRDKHARKALKAYEQKWKHTIKKSTLPVVSDRQVFCAKKFKRRFQPALQPGVARLVVSPARRAEKSESI